MTIKCEAQWRTFYEKKQIINFEVSFTPAKNNMTMEKQPFEGVSPIKKLGEFPMSC